MRGPTAFFNQIDLWKKTRLKTLKIITLASAILAALGVTISGIFYVFLEDPREDQYFSATGLVSKSWQVSETTTVTVYTFCGAISVHSSPAGTVRVDVHPHGVCKNGRLEDAQTSVDDVDVQLMQDGDSIRICVEKTPHPTRRLCGVDAAVDLYAPPGSRLVLATDAGSMLITGELAEIVATNAFGSFGADFVIDPSGEHMLSYGPNATLAAVGGALYLDGQHRAQVKPGDRVQVLRDRELFLNGVLVKPASSQSAKLYKSSEVLP